MRPSMDRLTAVLLFIQAATSTLILSDIQAIAEFPPACVAAYNTPISQCNSAHYPTGQLCSCSDACSAALNRLADSIVLACQGTEAPNSLIGLFLQQTAVGFLCTPPANAGACPPQGSGSGTSDGESSATQASAMQTRTTQTKQASASESLISKSKATPSLSRLASTSTATASMTVSTYSNVISLAITSSAASVQQTSNPGAADDGSGGGSPFDLAPENAGRALSMPSWTFLAGLTVAAILWIT